MISWFILLSLLLFLGNKWFFLHFLSFFNTEMTRGSPNSSAFILHVNTMAADGLVIQGTRASALNSAQDGIDLVLWEYSSLSTRKFNNLGLNELNVI